MPSSNSVWEMTLADFRDAIESRSTPGCGAVAAASAGMGLTLVLKGLRITDKKHPKRERAELVAQADSLLAQLGHYADEDAQAFQAYLAALKKPHDNGDQAKLRAQALDVAAERANRVPLDTAHTCLEALSLSVDALPLTAENLQSDTHGGARLLHAGLSAVLLNVDANLSSIADNHERDAMAQSRRDLQGEADQKMEVLS